MMTDRQTIEFCAIRRLMTAALLKPGPEFVAADGRRSIRRLMTAALLKPNERTRVGEVRGSIRRLMTAALLKQPNAAIFRYLRGTIRRLMTAALLKLGFQMEVKAGCVFYPPSDDGGPIEAS